MKVMTIAGTRPEWIRQACIIQSLDAVVEHRLVHTGQNYDYELSQVFFDDLGIRRPDHFLEAAGGRSAQTIANVIAATDTLFVEHRPDAVVLLGDTDSCFSAISARKNGIPVFHLEAGNRSFDLNVPEEVNRRIIDHTADFNLCYTEHARRNLLQEGLPARRVLLIGSPMRELLTRYEPQIQSSRILDTLGLERGQYYVASFHRQETVDYEQPLTAVVSSLEALAEKTGLPVIVSTHPRTRERLAQANTPSSSQWLRFMKPFGFFDYVALQQHSRCVISDSGTISEEASMLGFAAVTMRNSMERPEALEGGNVVICGVESGALLDCVEHVARLQERGEPAPLPPAEYEIRNTSERVLRLVLGLTGLARRWQGLNEWSSGRSP